MATKTLTLTPRVRQLMRQEITKFLVTMVTEQPDKNWPAIAPADLVDALADSLIEMGKTQKIGAALLQTLIHDLQDKVNAHLYSKE